MITYMLMGVIFSTVFGYEELYRTGTFAHYMKDFSSSWIVAGPSLQIVRGFLFAFVLWPLTGYLFKRENGWALTWLLFLGFAVIGTAGPAPGSLEGIIYTQLSFAEHLVGLPETMLQTLLFSVLLFRWYRHPARIYNTLSILLVLLILLMSIAGILMSRGIIKQ
jgi:hypothetical protein